MYLNLVQFLNDDVVKWRIKRLIRNSKSALEKNARAVLKKFLVWPWSRGVIKKLTWPRVAGQLIHTYPSWHGLATVRRFEVYPSTECRCEYIILLLPKKRNAKISKKKYRNSFWTGILPFYSYILLPSLRTYNNETGNKANILIKQERNEFYICTLILNEKYLLSTYSKKS